MYICVVLIVISYASQVDLEQQFTNNSHQPSVAGVILSDPNYQINSSFQAVVDLLQKTTDLSQKPCQNFNEFACGNYDTNFPVKDLNFDPLTKLNFANQDLMFKQLQQDSRENEVLPVKIVKQFYKQCTEYISAPDALDKFKDLLADIEDFRAATNIPFQALSNSLDDISLNSTQIGLALGKLYSDYLLFPNPSNFVAYFLFIEPNIRLRTSNETDPYLLTLPDSVNSFCKNYVNQSNVVLVLTSFFQKSGSTGITVSEEVVEGTIQDVVDILEVMKLNFCSSTAGLAKSNVKQGMTAQQLNDKYHTIDFKAFLKQFSSVASAEVQQKMNSDNFQIWLKGNGMLDVIDAVLGDPLKVCGRKIANLFYFNIIKRNNLWSQKQNNEAVCSSVARYYMPEPVDQLFIRALVPDKKERDLIRSRINTTTQYILRGFRSMVEQVSWLSPASRAKAIAKLDNMASI
uniref:Peptidase M13 N-terminal domain-containing protein n=1 Tax=Ditylenchus dipsaci TaxID=166011 RepID=A0A915D9R3_9BILA